MTLAIFPTSSGHNEFRARLVQATCPGQGCSATREFFPLQINEFRSFKKCPINFDHHPPVVRNRKILSKTHRDSVLRWEFLFGKM